MKRILDKFSRRLTFLLVFSIQMMFFVVLAQAQPTKNVLVLNSYHNGYPWSDSEMEGVRDVFAQSDVKIESYVKFMDLKRLSGEDYILRLNEGYRSGLKNIHFDAILVADNDALEFMRKYRDELFPGVPLVFCGINDYSERMLDGRKDITGVIEDAEYKETIELALRLRPKTKNVVAVIDDTTTGRAHRSAIEKIVPGFRGRASFMYLSMADYTLDEMGAKLASLEDDSVVLLLQHYKDKNGEALPAKESALFLIQRSLVPCFVVTDSRIGFGVVGGKVISGYQQGKVAAMMVMKILKGADISSLHVISHGTNQYIFDYSSLSRFHIPERILPKGAVLKNKPVSLLTEYKAEIISVIFIFILLFLYLLLLRIEIYRRKRVEGELRKSNDLYRLLTENLTDMVSCHDPEGRVLFVTPSAEKLLGYSPEEIVGRTVDIAMPAEDVEIAWKAIRSALERGELHYRVEHQMMRKDGQGIWVENNGSFIKDADGRLREIHCSVRDITARKLSDAEIVRQKELLETSSFAAKVALWEWDIGTGILQWSDVVDSMLGFEQGVFPRTIQAWRAIIHPDDLARVMLALEAHLKEDIRYDLEYRVRKQNGSYIWWRDAGVCYRDENSQAYRMAGACVEVTERKLIEEQLHQIYEFSETILDTADALVLALDIDGKIVRFNHACERISGWEAGQVIGRSILDFLVPQEQRAEVKEVLDRLSAGISPLRHENEWLTRDGARHWITWANSVIVNSTGDVEYIICTGIDIAERKHAEAALRESEQKFRTMADQSPVMIGVADEKGNITFLNKTWLDFRGKTLEEEAGWAWAEALHPDDRDRILQGMQVSIDRGENYSFEYRIQDRLGQYHWVMDTATPLRDNEGRNLGYIGTALDISERKRMEEELRKQVDELRSWYNVTIDREGRVQELKNEVNQILTRFGEPPRYEQGGEA